MYIPHVNRVCMEVGRLSPSLCPKGTSIPAPWARKRGTVLKSAVVGFRVPSSAGRTYGKKGNSWLISHTSHFGFLPQSAYYYLLVSSKHHSVYSA